MKNVIEIKAMSQEQAITRALKIMEATPEQVVNVIEKQKSKSFLERYFHGDITAMLSTYIENDHLSETELEDLKK